VTDRLYSRHRADTDVKLNKPKLGRIHARMDIDSTLCALHERVYTVRVANMIHLKTSAASTLETDIKRTYF